MCCSCCGVLQRKIWLFGSATLFLILGIVLTIWGPGFTENLVDDMLVLKEGSTTYEKWTNIPVPVYLQMYMFNWTNGEEVQKNGAKPNFERVGPYVFREINIKTNITWYENKTISFIPQRTWHFEPEMSAGSLEDLLTAPHIPSLAASSFVRDQSKFIKKIFNNLLNSNGGALYQTHTVNEWLFEGFYDEFLAFAKKQNNSLAPPIPSDHFAFLLNRNGSTDFEGTFTIHTGQNSLREMGEIKLWNGHNHTGHFEGECGRINGSTGELFVPKRDPNEYITVFNRDACRIINLKPIGRDTFRGIEGIHYETQRDTFDSGTLNPNMKCYCREPDNCPKPGATDLSNCAEGVPMYLSHVGFMYADPSYANTTTGHKPIEDNDKFYIILEPRLGIPLKMNIAIQISIRIQPDKDITILKDIKEFYAPLFVGKTSGEVDEKLARKIKVKLKIKVLTNASTIASYTGIALIILSIILFSVDYLSKTM
uniref:Protein croquemort n=1 Tax=Glossina brevipalpis TaxID=37001 RepID=A0A1A9WMF1_9MUSC